MKRVVLAALIAGVMATPGSAFAGTLVGSSSDPVDQPLALSGDSTPDITAVSLGYDADTGAVSADIVFAQSVSIYAPEYVSIDLGTPVGEDTPAAFCSPGISLVTLASSSGGTATRSTMTGSLPVSVTWNATRTAVNLAVSNGGLAGVGVVCAGASTSLFDEFGHCGNPSCSYISHVYFEDSVPPFGLVDSPTPFHTSVVPGPAPATPVVLAPSQPVAVTAPANVPSKIIKTRLTVKAKAPRCLNMITIVSSRINHPSALGRVKFTLRGAHVRRAYSIGVHDGLEAIFHDFTHLPRGKYTLTARYTGGGDLDSAARFAASGTVTKHLVISAC